MAKAKAKKKKTTARKGVTKPRKSVTKSHKRGTEPPVRKTAKKKSGKNPSRAFYVSWRDNGKYNSLDFDWLSSAKSFAESLMAKAAISEIAVKKGNGVTVATYRKTGKKNPFGLATAGEALSLLDHIKQKNPAVRLPDGTVLHGKSVNIFLKESARQNPKQKRNIQMGYYGGGTFHPIRSSIDYSPAAVGESFHHAPSSRSAKRLMDKKRTGKNAAKAKPTGKSASRNGTKKYSLKDFGNSELDNMLRGLMSETPSREQRRTLRKKIFSRAKALGFSNTQIRARVTQADGVYDLLWGWQTKGGRKNPNKKSGKRNLATAYPYRIEFRNASGVVDTGYARTKEDAVRRAKAFASKRADYRGEVINVASGQKTIVKRNPAMSRQSGQFNLYQGLNKKYDSLEALRSAASALGMKSKWRVVKGETIADIRTAGGRIVAVYRGLVKNRNPYLMLVNKGKGKKSKRNDGDGITYEKFHDLPSTKTTILDAPDSAPDDTERLGDAICIYYQVGNEKVAPAGTPKEGMTAHWIDFAKGVFVDSNKKGTQYFIVGKMPKFSANGVFGKATRIEYRTPKPHLEKGSKAPKLYYHPFGDEDGKRPTLATDHEGLLILKGGNYHTNEYGINN